MIKNSATKKISSEPEAVEQVEPVTMQQEIDEYHFAGGGQYFPMTVKAASAEEAHDIYLQKRVPYNP